MNSINNNNSNVVSSEQQTYKKPSALATIGGVAAGYATANVLPQILHTPIAIKCVKEMEKIRQNTSKDVFDKASGSFGKILKETGLDKKGVQIVRATENNIGSIAQIVENDLNEGIGKFFPKVLKEENIDNSIDQLKSGINAFFSPSSNKIIMPEKGMELSFFHEAGHAMNKHMSKIGKVLQKSRGATILMMPILLISLLTTKKAPNEEPKGFVDKTTTFIRDNAGKLTFLTFLPTILEEALASQKGNGLAKTFCPEAFINAVKSNRYGLATYASMAALSALCVSLGVKIKDKIASPKPINTQTEA